MKINHKPVEVPELGDKRMVRKFCFWKTLGNETRLFEMAYVRQHYMRVPDPRGVSRPRFIQRWVDRSWA